MSTPMKPETLGQSYIANVIHNLPNTVQNPLKSFHSKTQPLRSSFRALDPTIKSNKKQSELRKQWLQPDSIDPSFGIEGDTKEVKIRRSFRRLESSNLFNPPIQGAPLSELVPIAETQSRKYVLVEESRLAELAQIEHILQEEKQVMADQVTGVVGSFSVDARIPFPATRIAVSNLSKADMLSIEEQLSTLHVAWHNYCIKHNYDRIHSVLNKNSYLQGPEVLRGLKLAKLVGMESSKILACERDTMMFEDDLSYLNNQHYKAKMRSLDYDRYYVLASRYGYMDEEEYYKDDYPGRRYWIRCVDGALKFQQVWGMYWAIQKMRRRKGAMGFQKIIRGFLAWRKYHPLIVFRLKYGKRSYYEFVMSRWKSYNRILKMCKEAIIHALSKEWVVYTLNSWKSYTVASKTEKERKARKTLAKIMNAGLYKTFDALHKNAVRMRYIKIKMRRTIGFPQFDMWCEYVDQVKHVKKINKAASLICNGSRMRMARKRYKAKQHIATVLGLMIRSRVIAIRRRKKQLATGFTLWEMKESEVLAATRTEAERKRLARLQLNMIEAEKDNLWELKKHLRSGHGKIQLKEKAKWAVLASSKNEIMENEKKDLLKRCSFLHKSISKHDYCLKYPPFLTCVDPFCSSTFTSYRQYMLHWSHDHRHSQLGTSKAVSVTVKDMAKFRAKFQAPEYTEPPVAIVEEKKKKRYFSDDESSEEDIDNDDVLPLISSTKEADIPPPTLEELKAEKQRKMKADLAYPDYHCLLLNEKLREVHRTNLVKLMYKEKPGILKKGDGKNGKERVDLAAMLANMSDSDSENGENGNEKADVSDNKDPDDAEKEQIPLLEAAAASNDVTASFDEEDEDLRAKEDPALRNCINVLDLWSNIRLWKTYESSSLEYKTHAIFILDTFLKVPPVVPIRDPDDTIEGYEELYDLGGYFSDESDDTVIREEKAVIQRNIDEFRNKQLAEQEKLTKGMRIVNLPVLQYEINSIGTNIEEERYLIGEEGDLNWYDKLVDRLSTLKQSRLNGQVYKGHFKEMRLPRTCLRMAMGLPGKPYRIWTDEQYISPDFFNLLEFSCFKFLHDFVTNTYYNFEGSTEYIQYVEWCQAIEERRVQEMYFRCRDQRLVSFEKWSREEYYPKHMAIYRKSEETANVALYEITDYIINLACKMVVNEHVFENAYLEQIDHEMTAMVADESVHYCIDVLFEEWYGSSTAATLKVMLEMEETRSNLLIVAGMREKRITNQKKLMVDVDMTASSASLLDMLKDDPIEEKKSESITEGDEGDQSNDKSIKLVEKRNKYSGDSEEKGVESEEVPELNVIGGLNAPFNSRKAQQDQLMAMREELKKDACITIQRIGRGVLGRNKARSIFAKTYIKKYDSNLGACYYTNEVTLDASWYPPHIYKHLYPGKTW